jgi:uncharacterized Zn finger protein (UPF0148 family)
MTEHHCPKCNWPGLTEDEDYCEQCQWSIDLKDYLDNAPDEMQRELLDEIIDSLYLVKAWRTEPEHYSTCHTISSDRSDKATHFVEAEVNRWRNKKAQEASR